MSHWSDGYTVDINYTFGYFAELNPHQLAPLFLRAGLAVPKFATACELGYGMGASINIHAAASQTKWYGTDFNPNQALIAQSLAEKAGMKDKVTLSDEGFAEFCYREDLPDFDFIALHGIWSWISHENRMHIVDFVRRKLKVGGVLYISYNTLPGWSANAPIRHLMSQIDLTHSFVNQDRDQATKQVLEQADRVLAASTALTASSPHLNNRVKDLFNKNLRYVAHEYLNQHWQPMYYSEMESYLDQAKVSFACSLSYLEGFYEAVYSEEQREILKTIQNPSFKQTVQDYFKNTQFRKDLWIKGKQHLSRPEQSTAWDEYTVMLITPPEVLERAVQGTEAKITLLDHLINPLLAVLPLYQPVPVKKLRAQLSSALADDQLNDMLALLLGKNDLVLVQDPATVKAARAHTDKLNQYLIQKGEYSDELCFLASPVTGGGLYAERATQLFLLAHLQKVKRKDWAKFVWQIFDSQGKAFIKDGKKLETPEENMTHLTEMASLFEKEVLPKFQALQVV